MAHTFVAWHPHPLAPTSTSLSPQLDPPTLPTLSLTRSSCQVSPPQYLPTPSIAVIIITTAGLAQFPGIFLRPRRPGTTTVKQSHSPPTTHVPLPRSSGRPFPAPTSSSFSCWLYLYPRRSSPRYNCPRLPAPALTIPHSDISYGHLSAPRCLSPAASHPLPLRCPTANDQSSGAQVLAAANHTTLTLSNPGCQP
jgi:hypothetical protein